MKYALRPQQIEENRAERFDDVTQVPKREFCVCCEKLRTQSTGIKTAIGFVCHHCSRGAK